LEVLFEVGPESLRRFVWREGRGYRRSSAEVLVPSLTPLRVCAVGDEGKRVVVRLNEVELPCDLLAGCLRAPMAGVLAPGGEGGGEGLCVQAAVCDGDGDATGVLEAAARLGDVDAMFRLGVLHHGGEGKAVDLKSAVAWYRKAAERGHAGAMCTLGAMYASGEGVAVDSRAAIAWYGKAAERGHAGAMGHLGFDVCEW
jgi:hypothetical protein